MGGRIGPQDVIECGDAGVGDQPIGIGIGTLAQRKSPSRVDRRQQVAARPGELQIEQCAHGQAMICISFAFGAEYPHDRAVTCGGESRITRDLLSGNGLYDLAIERPERVGSDSRAGWRARLVDGGAASVARGGGQLLLQLGETLCRTPWFAALVDDQEGDLQMCG